MTKPISGVTGLISCSIVMLLTISVCQAPAVADDDTLDPDTAHEERGEIDGTLLARQDTDQRDPPAHRKRPNRLSASLISGLPAACRDEYC